MDTSEHPTTAPTPEPGTPAPTPTAGRTPLPDRPRLALVAGAALLVGAFLGGTTVAAFGEGSDHRGAHRPPVAWDAGRPGDQHGRPGPVGHDGRPTPPHLDGARDGGRDGGWAGDRDDDRWSEMHRGAPGPAPRPMTPEGTSGAAGPSDGPGAGTGWAPGPMTRGS